MGEKRTGRSAGTNEPRLGRQSLADVWKKRHGLPETLVVDRGRDSNQAGDNVLARLLERPGHDEKTRKTERISDGDKILIQRVEFDQDGNPVLVHDVVRIERPLKERSTTCQEPSKRSG